MFLADVVGPSRHCAAAARLSSGSRNDTSGRHSLPGILIRAGPASHLACKYWLPHEGAAGETKTYGRPKATAAEPPITDINSQGRK